MPRRGDHIRKRKDGRWEGRYRIEIGVCGTVAYRSVYGRTYAEVKQKLSDVTPRSQTAAPTVIKFEEALDLWLQSNRIRYKEATLSKYTYLINKHIKPALGRVSLSQLGAVDINMFLDEKIRRGRLNHSGGLSPAYVRTMMLIIHAAVKLAVAEGYCKPLSSPVNKPVPAAAHISIFTAAEREILVRHLTESHGLTELGMLISLFSGLRIGEICSLSWDDVDWEEAIVHINKTVVRINDSKGSRWHIDTPKTNASYRDIPIPVFLLSRLQSAYAERQSEYLISDKAGFLNPRTYDYRYHGVLKECGIRQLKYHTLRHTFASNALANGMDVKTLSEILGHKDSSITLAIYVHSSMEVKRKQMEQVCRQRSEI